MSKGIFSLPAEYSDWLTSLKQRILGARQRAILAVNDAQTRLYHEIGREILYRQSQQAGVPSSLTGFPQTYARLSLR
jgi:hypothetical protein